MAALNFPSSPTNGQVYTANGVTFTYDSTVGAWEGTISIGTASVTASETPPVSPSAGNLWFSTDEGSLYVYYDSFWVDISGATGASGVIAATSPLTYNSETQTVAINQSLIGIAQSQVTNLTTDLAAKAPLISPTFTGPTVVDVNSSSTALRITQVGSGNALVVEDSTNPDATPFVVTADGTVGIGIGSTGGLKLVVSDGTVNTTTNPSGGVSYFGTTSAHPLAIISNNTERMRITSAGNVGIGKTTPGHKLDVNGTVNATEVLVNGNPRIGLESVFLLMGS